MRVMDGVVRGDGRRVPALARLLPRDHRRRDVSRIYLCGGSAKVPALQRILAERSRVPVEIIDPFRRLIIDQARFDMDFIRAHAAEATVGLGLALRRQGDRA